MIARMRDFQRRTWHERSKAARVELQSVLTWCVTPWVFWAFWLVLPLVAGHHDGVAETVLSASLVLGSALQCATGNRLVRPVLDHYLGRAPLPGRALRAAAGLPAGQLAVIGVLHACRPADPSTGRMALGATLLTFGLLYGLVVPPRVFVRRAAVCTAVLMAVYGLARADVTESLVTGVLAAFATLFSLLAARCGAWTLSVLWEAERAREVEARLAVAEERLRFGRDLHDVMGRNLAVIALKAELAVQLAQRGRPEAVAQMTEVQRLARESQREVRAVVRGYREADLHAELAGAQGVLAAAGIDCAVSGSAAGLPGPVQSALGWVVREAATNVLRHGDARSCSVTLRVANGRAELSVENDGVPEGGTGGGPGTGLVGLRERLAELDGTLRAGPAGRGRFRLTAEVPLPPAGPSAPLPRPLSEVPS
ncbi:histidine kinase [Streptomyces sp. NPDC046831]|uniref:sensor histidine kinase n=1 Tax=Streptomyces sp. NPDC046831 TaxID=3154805 RepID=UPI0033FC051F